MHSRARRLSTGLTIAIATGTASILAAPAAVAAEPKAVGCDAVVTGEPGTEVLFNAAEFAPLLHGAAATQLEELDAQDAQHEALTAALKAVPKWVLPQVPLNPIGAERSTLESDAVSRAVVPAVQDLAEFQALASQSPEVADALITDFQTQVLEQTCRVTITPVFPKPEPKPEPEPEPEPEPQPQPGPSPEEQAAKRRAAEQERLRQERAEQRAAERRAAEQRAAAQRSARPEFVPEQQLTPQPTGSDSLAPLFRTSGQAGGVPGFTDPSGELFRPPNANDPEVARTGNAVPTAAGPQSTSDGIGLALILAVLGVSGAGGWFVRWAALRRARA